MIDRERELDIIAPRRAANVRQGSYAVFPETVQKAFP
jgi:hypothetical protein